MTVQFPASMLKNEGHKKSLKGLLNSYMAQGGTYLQFNIMDAAKLKEAKKKPEEHQNLLVRVAGYSAFFVTLSPEVQDEIISRSEHTV